MNVTITALLICGASWAAEIHLVGDGAYKCVDDEWVQTAPERIGDMSAVWAFSENDVFIGDYIGAVFH